MRFGNIGKTIWRTPDPGEANRRQPIVSRQFSAKRRQGGVVSHKAEVAPANPQPISARARFRPWIARASGRRVSGWPPGLGSAWAPGEASVSSR